eukprot:CAMPEP_0176306954 /NCGR_PEP_ID=MMETSP0121_2-20121125/63764_1 /TAXON_ID=160619 /ORGANISM="Kryptoperidinium foliaceum, Strain CCMP 1326" /LENGTH=112 /DNA_ID=CAMNT_0017648711 /DNA_START=40 /DNA_END=375 /DNA_ORIENTATION=-
MGARYADMLGIVSRMLEKDPQKRWSAGHALTVLLTVAHIREVEAPPRRQEAALPDAWREDWLWCPRPSVSSSRTIVASAAQSMDDFVLRSTDSLAHVGQSGRALGAASSGLL